MSCTRNIEDNLHIKDSYELISHTRYRNDTIFDFDMDREGKAIFEAFSQKLGDLPKLLTGELPKLKLFVTTNKGETK